MATIKRNQVLLGLLLLLNLSLIFIRWSDDETIISEPLILMEQPTGERIKLTHQQPNIKTTALVSRSLENRKAATLQTKPTIKQIP